MPKPCTPGIAPSYEIGSALLTAKQPPPSENRISIPQGRRNRSNGQAPPELLCPKLQILQRIQDVRVNAQEDVSGKTTAT